MGWRKRYHNPRIVRYDETPSGRTLTDKFAIVEGCTLISAVCGLTKSEAVDLLPYYQNLKHYVFNG